MNINRVGTCHVRPLTMIGLSENTAAKSSGNEPSRENSRPRQKAPSIPTIAVTMSTARIEPSSGPP